jgi:hypothetical protein
MSRITIRPIGPLAALLVMLIGLGAYGKFVSHPTRGPNGTAPALTTQAEKDNLEVELITLRPEGFEPLQITRPKGPFVLVVDDRSGKEASSLRLQRVKGEHLRDLNTNRKKSEWYDLVDLPPGDYVLSDAENPDWRCQITLLP